MPKLEKAQRASQYAEKRLTTATAVSAKLNLAPAKRLKKLAAVRAQVTHHVTAKTKVALAKKQAVATLKNMPAEIYERGLGRDNIATCLKVMVVAPVGGGQKPRISGETRVRRQPAGAEGGPQASCKRRAQRALLALLI